MSLGPYIGGTPVKYINTVQKGYVVGDSVVCLFLISFGALCWAGSTCAFELMLVWLPSFNPLWSEKDIEACSF